MTRHLPYARACAKRGAPCDDDDLPRARRKRARAHLRAAWPRPWAAPAAPAEAMELCVVAARRAHARHVTTVSTWLAPS